MIGLLGYADRISARPGETIQIMVSTDSLDSYDAELVRIIQGDVNPDGPGYEEEVIPHDLGGSFTGRFQPINLGSYGVVDDNSTFANLKSFGVLAAVWPTLPGQGCQVILSRQDPVTGVGFQVMLDEFGALAIEIQPKGGKSTICSTGHALAKEIWYAVTASYEAETGRLTVGQVPLHTHPGVEGMVTKSCATNPNLSQDTVKAPIMLAAQRTSGTASKHHFNGRIDSPRLFSRPLQMAEVRDLLDIDIRHPDFGDLIAAWDFSIGISSDKISDVSAHRFHGQLVNLPTRGVTGRKWTGAEHDWTKMPSHYGAIHFHDDDLYNCRWDVDFSVTLPENLSSGVYAVRLYGEDEEYYVSFAIRPPIGKATAPVAYLLPTASYLAYANDRTGNEFSETEIVTGRLLQFNKNDLLLQEHPELGLCFYNIHNDGSANFYSSRLRPIINMQPKHIGQLGGIGSNLWQFNADTHITGWLAHIDQSYDVITDEDLEKDGFSALAGYQTVITGTHPEYYSLGMLDTIQSYVNTGGRLMYLGANGFYWRVSYHPEMPGVIECRKSEDGIRAAAPRSGENYASFTGEYTGLWRRNDRPPNRLVGIGMVAQGFDISAPYHRTEASHDPRAAFIFDGVDDEIIGDFGLSGGGAAGLELDAANPETGTPPHILVLASSQNHTDVYMTTPEEINDPVPGLGGSEAEIVRSDMVFFETLAGGAVFSTGSIAWAGSLSHDAYDNNVAKITTNVLKRFMNKKTF